MTYKKFYKYYSRWKETGKMSRKFKKNILGKRLNKTKLKKLIDSVKIIDSENMCMYSPEILPFEFCPNCGCQSTRHVDYGVPYPEIWCADFCLRCGYEVGGADNSRYIHVLEEMVEEYGTV